VVRTLDLRLDGCEFNSRTVTAMCLSPSGINWYQPNGGDVLQLGR